MAGLRKKQKRDVPEVNTASLPDLVFTILFFFMMITSMREVSLKVQFRSPIATELTKLEKKSLATYIYIGKPNSVELVAKMGNETRLQLNDQIADISEVGNYIAQEKASMKEEDQPFMTTYIKGDYETTMGIITDLKQALREAYALKISYSAKPKASSGGKR